MKRLRVGLSLMLSIMLAANSLICPLMAFAQEPPKIVSVEVSGNRNISTAAILANVGSKPGNVYSDEQAEKDVAAIKAMGYFVSVTSRTVSVPGGVQLIFEVAENEKVTQIVITGNTAIPTETILAQMQTKVGEVLNVQTLSRDVEAIARLYRDKGFIGQVTEDLNINEQGVLTIPIQEGRIESIRIAGIRKTKEYVIRRELRTRPGDLYDANKISADIRRIFNLDIFEDVNARPELGSAPGLVVLTINVVERKTGQVSVGFAYSDREKLVGRAELSETNFRGKGEGVNLMYEVGGRAGGSSFEVGFFEPWLDARHTSMSVSLYNRLVYRFQSNLLGQIGGDLGTVRGYNERRKGGTILFGRPLSEFIRARIGLRDESVDTDFNLGTTVVQENPFLFQNGRVMTVTAEGIRDTRDFILDPTTGSYLSAVIEPGRASMERRPEDPTVLTFGNFIKYGAEYRRYLPVFSKNLPRERRRVLAARFMARTSSKTLPFFEQYFLGGADTLRGYVEDRFWGKNMVLATVELRYPFAKNLQGVLFTDVGDAWNTPYTLSNLPQTNTFKAHVGYGFGLRVKTPIGPLRLDYGIGSEGTRTHFSIGQVF